MQNVALNAELICHLSVYLNKIIIIIKCYILITDSTQNYFLKNCWSERMQKVM